MGALFVLVGTVLPKGLAGLVQGFRWNRKLSAGAAAAPARLEEARDG